jgi:hypothetical protein
MKRQILFLILLSIFYTSCATRVIMSSPAEHLLVIKRAPVQHKVVLVKGKRYYHWNGKYHRKSRRGYVVVKM